MQKQIFEFLGRRIELWAHPDPDHMGRTIRVNRSFYEIDVLMKCREIYLPGSAIIDVGANIGNHAVFFGAILNAPVYAFEPYEANRDLLERNIAVNGLDGRVVSTCCAIGETNAPLSADQGSPASQPMTRASFGNGEVNVKSLDSLSISGPVGLLRVDVEGAEVAILRGAATLIGEWLPDVVVEAGERNAFKAIAKLLLGYGYVPRGCYASTPTYLFSATDQERRMRNLLTLN
jgi:FkbM family methyltransferase